MKTWRLSIVALFCAGLSPVQAQVPAANQAEVVAAPGSDCADYFAVKTNDTYALLEWFGGPMPDKGDKVQGDFASYGYKDIFLLPNGARMRVYVEDYDLSIDDANDKLKGKCK